MKNEKRIIAYLDKQMSLSEAKAFEKDLDSSPELEAEFERYKNFFNEMNELKNIPAKEDYFNKIIQPFKRKHYKKRKIFSTHPKFAFGITVIVIVFLIGYLIFNLNADKTDTSIENIVSNINEDELSQLLTAYQNDYDNLSAPNGYENQDSLLNKMIYTELNLSDNGTGLLSSYNENLNDVIKNLNDEEADIIYNEILNKNFF